MSNNPQVSLAEGQLVKVTVLKDNGNGSCLVSFGGGKFNVRTEKSVDQGETFDARVFYADGKLFLKPEEARPLSQSFINFMNSSGLVPDGITARIIQFMEQSGVKIDRKFLQKARAVALNFPGKENAAGEIACMLLEKGIEPTEERVARLLSVLDQRGQTPRHQGQTSEQRGQTPEHQGQTPDSPDSKDDSSHVLDGENEDGGENHSHEENTSGNGDYEDDDNLLDEIYSVLPCKKTGLLGFLNHYRSDGERKHWVVLPFEWERENGCARGIVKFLLDCDRKTTEKVQISCDFTCKKYYFVLYYDNGKVKEVRFCSLPLLLTSEIKNEEKRLGELFCSGMNDKSVPVTYSPFAYSEGLYSSSENPFTFEDVV